ncbi:MAG: hypothetical protein J1E16_04245 [Muribaculaceae bacterium]|nr:hypothetical protein [Muribaculaceae bacterium]
MNKENIKDKYWKDGNIFEMNDGSLRMVWGNQAIDSPGYIPKGYFDESLTNMDSIVRECVIRVYSPNFKACCFNELIKPQRNNLLWEKAKHIYTKKQLKDLLKIKEEEELIIIREE